MRRSFYLRVMKVCESHNKERVWDCESEGEGMHVREYMFQKTTSAYLLRVSD